MSHSTIIAGSDNQLSCMTLIAGRKASASGYVMIGHNEDDPGLLDVRHGYVPAADWPEGTYLPTERNCVPILQAPHTFGYYWTEIRSPDGGYSTADSFLNERGVTIVSNNMGGSREEPLDTDDCKPGGILFNLRRILAERSGSAREGAGILMDLMDTYGYAQSGRAYTIADRNEAFMFQLVQGHHYIGARVPDDALVIMPNHYTFHTLHDCPETFCSKDLIPYSIRKGWYTPSIQNNYSDFDFAKTYQAPEAYRSASNTKRQSHGTAMLLGTSYETYENSDSYPFCVKATHPVNVSDFKAVLSTHYEGSPDFLECAGPGRSPHNTAYMRRICTVTTQESLIVDYADDLPMTVVHTAFGRPCQTPYLPLHPLLGLPAEMDPIENPAVAMESHLRPEPEACTYRSGIMAAFRDYQSVAELLYAQLEPELRPVLNRISDRAESALNSCTDAQSARDADRTCILYAYHSLQEFFGSHVHPVTVSDPLPIRHTRPEESLTVLFAADSIPVENNMVLGPAHLGTRTHYEQIVPGSLKHLGPSIWSARFSINRLLELIHFPGNYRIYLGGMYENGIPFMGKTILSVID